MQPQQTNNEDFDFSKKITTIVEKQVKKVDYSSYKKLAFFAIAIGVFVSAGVYIGNHLLPTLLGSTNIVSTIVPSNEVVKNLNIQTQKISPQDLAFTNEYYNSLVNIYDNKFNYVNQTLLQYNLQTTFSDVTVSQDNFVRMAKKINQHKEDIIDTINKFNSLSNKIISKDNLSYHEAQFVLNCVTNAKQHIYYQNTDVEKEFNKNLFSANKDITKYLMSHNSYEKIKSLDEDIKKLFQTLYNFIV